MSSGFSHIVPPLIAPVMNESCVTFTERLFSNDIVYYVINIRFHKMRFHVNEMWSTKKRIFFLFVCSMDFLAFWNTILWISRVKIHSISHQAWNKSRLVLSSTWTISNTNFHTNTLLSVLNARRRIKPRIHNKTMLQRCSTQWQPFSGNSALQFLPPSPFFFSNHSLSLSLSLSRDSVIQSLLFSRH